MVVVRVQRARVFRYTPTAKIWAWTVKVLPFVLVLLVVFAMCFIAITRAPALQKRNSLKVNSLHVAKLKPDPASSAQNKDFQLERLLKSKPPNLHLFVTQLKNEANGYCAGKLAELQGNAEKSNVISERLEPCRPKPWCPKIPPVLYGAEKLDSVAVNMTEEEIVDAVGSMGVGGSWAPDDCKARHSVCIIIPYRDRKDHLWTLLYRLIPVLKRQQLDFKIFVVEQVSNVTFNKGAIMNAAFLTIYRTYGLRGEGDWHKGLYGCYVFHDVDMLPEDDRNMYSCPEFPRHLSVAVNEFKYQENMLLPDENRFFSTSLRNYPCYSRTVVEGMVSSRDAQNRRVLSMDRVYKMVQMTRLPYHKLVGGVFNIRPDHYFLVNGYSNLFWGWGGEDDDMGYRLEQVGLPITRPPERLARYTMVKHVKRKPLAHAVRLKLVHTSQKRYRADGLNTLKYEVFRVDTEKLYTRILVGVGDMPEYVRSFEVGRRTTATVQNKRWK